MSGVEIRQRAASEGQRGDRRAQELGPASLHGASWSTDFMVYSFLLLNTVFIFVFFYMHLMGYCNCSADQSFTDLLSVDTILSLQLLL